MAASIINRITGAMSWFILELPYGRNMRHIILSAVVSIATGELTWNEPSFYLGEMTYISRTGGTGYA